MKKKRVLEKILFIFENIFLFFEEYNKAIAFVLGNLVGWALIMHLSSR